MKPCGERRTRTDGGGVREVITRGDIYYVKGPPHPTGGEQAKDRPAIIVSNNKGNLHAPIVEVVYLTGSNKKALPTHALIASAERPSIALCEQINTLSKARLGRYVGHLTEEEQAGVDRAMAVSIGLDGRMAEKGGAHHWTGKKDYET